MNFGGFFGGGGNSAESNATFSSFSGSASKWFSSAKQQVSEFAGSFSAQNSPAASPTPSQMSADGRFASGEPPKRSASMGGVYERNIGVEKGPEDSPAKNASGEGIWTMGQRRRYKTDDDPTPQPRRLSNSESSASTPQRPPPPRKESLEKINFTPQSSTDSVLPPRGSNPPSNEQQGMRHGANNSSGYSSDSGFYPSSDYGSGSRSSQTTPVVTKHESWFDSSKIPSADKIQSGVSAGFSSITEKARTQNFQAGIQDVASKIPTDKMNKESFYSGFAGMGTKLQKRMEPWGQQLGFQGATEAKEQETFPGNATSAGGIQQQQQTPTRRATLPSSEPRTRKATKKHEPIVYDIRIQDNVFDSSKEKTIQMEPIDINAKITSPHEQKPIIWSSPKSEGFSKYFDTGGPKPFQVQQKTEPKSVPPPVESTPVTSKVSASASSPAVTQPMKPRVTSSPIGSSKYDEMLRKLEERMKGFTVAAPKPNSQLSQRLKEGRQSNSENQSPVGQIGRAELISRSMNTEGTPTQEVMTNTVPPRMMSTPTNTPHVIKRESQTNTAALQTKELATNTPIQHRFDRWTNTKIITHSNQVTETTQRRLQDRATSPIKFFHEEQQGPALPLHPPPPLRQQSFGSNKRAAPQVPKQRQPQNGGQTVTVQADIHHNTFNQKTSSQHNYQNQRDTGQFDDFPPPPANIQQKEAFFQPISAAPPTPGTGAAKQVSPAAARARERRESSPRRRGSMGSSGSGDTELQDNVGSAESVYSVDLDADPDCGMFIAEFVERIFEGKEVEPIEKARFAEYAQQPIGRRWFARIVSIKCDEVKEVGEVTFMHLVQYFAIMLLECCECEDFNPAKHLMELCFAIHVKIRQGDEPRQHFLYSYLREQPIWMSANFWNVALFDAVQKERARRETSALQDEAALVEEILFEQLRSFLTKMRAFDISRQVCSDFLHKHAEQAGMARERVRSLEYALK